MLDHVIRNAQRPLAEVGELVDIGIKDGRIAAIATGLASDAPSSDVAGALVCGGLIETHIHLDKSQIVDRCAPEPSKSSPDHMRRVQAVKAGFTEDDIYARARQTLEAALKHGTTRIRAHTEIDLPVGIKGVTALQQLAKDYRWAVDLELCVFAQEGLSNVPAADAALVAGLKAGARAIGAAPNYDVDHAAQIHRVFELGRDYDVEIDLHIDSGHDPANMDLHLVAELTKQYKRGGRVAIGHVTKPAGLPGAQQREIAAKLADAGVAVTVLPATDLFVLGRHMDHNTPRCVADANLYAHAGCTCSLSTNNVMNPFTPMGDASLIRIANLHANILQVSAPGDVADLFSMITERSARLMNLTDYGLQVGKAADVTVIDARSTVEAVRRIAPVLAVFKRGRQTVRRPRAELLRPTA